MKKIFVIGNIGCGKSTFTKLITKSLKSKNYNTQIIDLDKIGHEVLSNASVKKALVAKFGFIARTDLSKVVFKSPSNVKILNEITHPFIYQELNTLLDDYVNLGVEYVVVEQTVVSGQNDKFLKIADYIVCLNADEQVRKQRAAKKGLNLQDFIARNKSQINQKLMVDLSDFVIDNNKDVDNLNEQIQKLIECV